MKTTLRIVSSLAVACILLQGCNIDDSYNLGNINTEVNLGKNTTLPLPDFDEIKIKDLINVGENSEVVTVVDGNYVVSLTAMEKEIEGFSLNSDSFKINATGNQSHGVSLSSTVIPANTPISFSRTSANISALQGLGIDVNFFDSLLEQEYKVSSNVDFSNYNFTTLVKSIKNCVLDGNLSFSLVPSGIPFNNFYLKANSTITFPSFVRFSSCDNPSFTIVDGHILKATSDVTIPMNTGITLSLAFAGMDFGEGKSTVTHLDLKGDIAIDGKIAIKPEDFSGQTTNINLATYGGSGLATVVRNNTSLGSFAVNVLYSATNVALSEATVKLNVNSALPSFADSYFIDVEGLPDFLSGNDTHIGLADVHIAVDVDSKLPFGFDFSGKLHTLKNGTETHNYSIGPLSFEGNTVTKYSLGTRADGTGEDGTIYRKLNDIENCLNPVPTRVEMDSFSVTAHDSDWISVQSGKEYGGAIKLGVEAPISFTSESQVSLNTTLDDVALDINGDGGNYSVEQIVLDLKAVNTIPLNFEVSAVALGENGSPLETVSSSVNSPIAGGTLENPSSTNISVTVNIAKKSPAIKGLRVSLKAYSSDELAGKVLNENQGIKLTNVVASLPKGFSAVL